jgi:hypothetical protein
MLRRIQGIIELSSGELLVEVAADLEARTLTCSVRRPGADEDVLGSLTEAERAGVELVCYRHLWMHVARTDPSARREIAAIDARVAFVERVQAALGAAP